MSELDTGIVLIEYAAIAIVHQLHNRENSPSADAVQFRQEWPKNADPKIVNYNARFVVYDTRVVNVIDCTTIGYS